MNVNRRLTMCEVSLKFGFLSNLYGIVFLKVKKERINMFNAAEAVETMDGWYTLHDFRKVDWSAWQSASEEERQQALAEFEDLLTSWEKVETQQEGSHGLFQIIGQKADLMLIWLRPTMEDLAATELALNKSLFGRFLQPTHSHLSVVELSKYQPSRNGVDPETLPETQARLKPQLPDWQYVSFYPMSRKREAVDNWYSLSKGIRSKLLYDHSLTGRKYSGKVKQIITGSIGFDEHEWGVTLFAHDAIELKKIVYEMRFDVATARYGEFADFYIGMRLNKESLPAFLA